MESETNRLTAEQYHTLYLQAFSRLEDIISQTEQTMQELSLIHISEPTRPY